MTTDAIADIDAGLDDVFDKTTLTSDQKLTLINLETIIATARVLQSAAKCGVEEKTFRIVAAARAGLQDEAERLGLL